MIAAVVPIKQLFCSKTRLASICTQAQREELCLSMLHRMLSQFTACERIAQVYIISPDPAIKAWLTNQFPTVQFLHDTGDLNECAAHAAAYLTEHGVSQMLFALGDLPLLTLADIHTALDAAAASPIVLLPDRMASGTNAVIVSPPTRMQQFYFGLNSLQLHCNAAKALGLTPAVLQLSGFSFDVDQPEDLRQLAAYDIQSTDPYSGNATV